MKRQNPFSLNRISWHLVFNALNSASALCRKNPEQAAELLDSIGTYLQKSLENKTTMIPLSEELEHVMAYITIQKTRFSDRIQFYLKVEQELHFLIPAFILQPLVDNALRHGILKRRQGGTVSLEIRSVSQGIDIVLSDDGLGISKIRLSTLLKRENRGHSLHIVNRRLKAAGFSGLQIFSCPNSGTRVAIHLETRHV